LLKVNEPGVIPTVIDTVPFPLKLIVCGLPEPDEVTVIVPARVPVAVGLKVTDIVQVAFSASVVPQVVVRLKSPVAAEIDIPLIAPLFAVSVITCAGLVVVTSWAPKTTVPGDMPIVGRTPNPVRPTVCGLPAPDDVIVTPPVRVPATVGENVTVTVHVLFRANVAAHVFVWLKSPDAEIEIPLIPPLFAVSVTDCVALEVPTVWLLKVNDPVESPIAGWIPVPDKLIVCGLPKPFEVTVMLPVRVPAAVGVNVTLMVQDVSIASDAAHVFV
jgi:hypothetical protein